MAKLSYKKVEAALRQHHGILSKAAEACGVARMTMYRFIENNPGLEEVRMECSEELLDVAETAIANAIKVGDMKTVRWYTERKGKDRGYTTREERTGANGEPLQFEAIERTVVDPRDKEGK